MLRYINRWVWSGGIPPAAKYMEHPTLDIAMAAYIEGVEEATYDITYEDDGTNVKRIDLNDLRNNWIIKQRAEQKWHRSEQVPR